jgi:hypothetical protein
MRAIAGHVARVRVDQWAGAHPLVLAICCARSVRGHIIGTTAGTHGHLETAARIVCDHLTHNAALPTTRQRPRKRKGDCLIHCPRGIAAAFAVLD